MAPSTTAREQMRDFLAAIFEPTDVVEIRAIDGGRVKSSWHRADDEELVLDACLRASRLGFNVFVGVNPRRAAGQRGNAGVALARCLFVDFDAAHLASTSPAAQIAEALDRIGAAMLPAPTVVSFSGHGVHVFWRLLNPLEDLTCWDELMDGLITAMGSDRQVKGGDRVMRMPGLPNLKPPITLAELWQSDGENRYDVRELERIVKLHAPPAPKVDARIDRAVAAHSCRPVSSERPSVIDAYNDAVGIRDVLESRDYDVAGRYFRRPGKTDRGFSGIFRKDARGRLVSVHFSGNDPLHDGRFGGGTCAIHDAFSAFCELEHGGDVRAAVKAAAATLHVPLPEPRADLAILEEITNGPQGDEFARHFFSPRTGDSRRAMAGLLALFTDSRAQIDRIIAMSARRAA